MQKHTKLTVLATLGAVALGATLIGAVPALAAGNGNGYGRESLQAELSQTTDIGSRGCASFVDVNGDGICDNYESGAGNGAGYIDADGDGICDNYGTGAGRGNGDGYADADSDGVCDNYGTGAGGGHHGRHGARHHGGGRGHC